MSYKSNKKEYTPPSSPYCPSTWIDTLKIIYKAVFGVIILLGVIVCIRFCSNDHVGLGLMILIVSVLAAVLSVGFAMVFLDIASDMRDMVNYAYQIGSMIEEDKKQDVAGDIEKTAENIYQIKTMLENNAEKNE